MTLDEIKEHIRVAIENQNNAWIVWKKSQKEVAHWQEQLCRYVAAKPTSEPITALME